MLLWRHTKWRLTNQSSCYITRQYMLRHLWSPCWMTDNKRQYKSLTNLSKMAAMKTKVYTNSDLLLLSVYFL